MTIYYIPVTLLTQDLLRIDWKLCESTTVFNTRNIIVYIKIIKKENNQSITVKYIKISL